MDDRSLSRALRVTSVAVVATGLLIVALQLMDRRTAGPTGGPAIAGAPPQGAIASPRPAPSFALPRLQGGGALALDAMSGHVVVINFWASWCTDCRKEAPDLASLWRSYAPRGVRFVGIDYVDGRNTALGFLRSTRVPYDLVVDRSGGVGARFGVQGLPTTFIVDATGRLRYRALGLLRADAFRAALDEVLRQPA